MKLYFQILKLVFSKIFLRRSNGAVIKSFAESMGVVYIKLAQMLATQNYGNLFTEQDRQALSSICDDCNPIDYAEIEKILHQEYGPDLDTIFTTIEREPVGSASVSQVHRAVLQSGEVVAVKVRRPDISRTIERDLARIRKIVRRFGRIFKFRNFTGSDRALELYLEWIHEETDFLHEQQNIKLYQEFADNVNGKVRGTSQIKVPHLYPEYCTTNVIVMEFILVPTINKLELTDINKTKIVEALNSYIRSSFWAMFNDQTIVFHGDPHSGNICVDDRGDIYFLDMGLLCALSDEDALLCRQFFLTAYSGNAEKMYDMLVGYGDMSEKQRQAFRQDCETYCRNIQAKEVTYYFIDMMNICLKYEFVPPNFLFSMAKAFVCLNGIANFTGNQHSARELLQEQAVEFFLRRSLDDLKEVATDSLTLIPDAISNTLERGIASTMAKLTTNTRLHQSLKKSLNHLEEVLDLLALPAE